MTDELDGNRVCLGGIPSLDLQICLLRFRRIKRILSDITTKKSTLQLLKHLDCAAFPDPLRWK